MSHHYKISVICCALFLTLSSTAMAVGDSEASLHSTSEGTINRVAPGEFLPISIKLVNFGSQKRVDVSVSYQILDSNNKEVYSESETVAVDTTASFIKRLPIPSTLKPGQYTALSSLRYPDQEQPAVSKFPFLVEQKVGGIFKSDLIFYFVAVVAAISAGLAILYLLSGWGRKNASIVLHDYSDKPKNEIIYYELLSDIIAQMRLHIGDKALDIAKDTPDLEINPKTGLIINIKNDPAKIIASLILRYEKLSGRPISFGLRNK